MKLIIAIIINDHFLTSDPYFWEIFSALPANFYTSFNFSCHIFNFKELFSFSFVQFYDILIYFMVFLLSLGILMIVLHMFLKLCFPCRVSFIQAAFFLFVCLYVCLYLIHKRLSSDIWQSLVFYSYLDMRKWRDDLKLWSPGWGPLIINFTAVWLPEPCTEESLIALSLGLSSWPGQIVQRRLF